MTENILPILTIDQVEGHRAVPVGSVYACCCLSKSIVEDTIANVKNWSVGGELKNYTRMLEKATAMVYERLRENARELDADAVLGFRLTTSDVSAGAAEIIGYGTAVKLMPGE
jgi:uncharacterized protein YbjQ (UPF0145 family)